MYALKNFEKFVRDNSERLGGKAEGILERARKASQKGIISGGSTGVIMNDTDLAEEFDNFIMLCPDHLEIAFSAVRAADEAPD